MIQEREFDRLEKFVNRLLAQFNQLREEKSLLESQLRKKESEIEELGTELLSADSARGDITARVKGLIEQIEEWESTLNEAGTGGDSKDDTEVDSEEELELELETEIETVVDVESESKTEAEGETVSDQVVVAAVPVVDDIREEEKDGGLQQSLFNVEPRPTNMDG